MRAYTKITIAVLVTLLVVSLALVFFVAHYTVVFVLDSKACGELLPLEINSHDPATGRPSPSREWMLLSSKKWMMESQDGLVLRGYYIPAAQLTHRYVILGHGYKNSATSMAGYAHVYHNAGWNVPVPDRRAHGYSQGRCITMGWKEHQDLIGWAGRLVERDSAAQILLHGLSMGAATVMMATGSADLPQNVLAAIEDCGYTTFLRSLPTRFPVSRVRPSFRWFPPPP